MFQIILLCHEVVGVNLALCLSVCTWLGQVLLRLVYRAPRQCECVRCWIHNRRQWLFTSHTFNKHYNVWPRWRFMFAFFFLFLLLFLRKRKKNKKANENAWIWATVNHQDYIGTKLNISGGIECDSYSHQFLDKEDLTTQFKMDPVLLGYFIFFFFLCVCFFFLFKKKLN